MAQKQTKTLGEVTEVTTADNNKYVPIADANGNVNKINMVNLASVVAEQNCNATSTLTSSDDLNGVLQEGRYIIYGGQRPSNLPTADFSTYESMLLFVVIVRINNNRYYMQHLITDNFVFERLKWGNNNWGPWKRLY